MFSPRTRLRPRVSLELQKWQSKRLMRSHADLRANPRYRQAVEFFFNELYNGGDPRGRDRDVMRVQRVMEKLLPREALAALCLAIELEVLSQELDADVVRGLPDGPISVETYAEGYRRAGRRPDRERQIELLGVIGSYLDRVVSEADHPQAGPVCAGPGPRGRVRDAAGIPRARSRRVRDDARGGRVSRYYPRP